MKDVKQIDSLQNFRLRAVEVANNEVAERSVCISKMPFLLYTKLIHGFLNYTRTDFMPFATLK